MGNAQTLIDEVEIGLREAIQQEIDGNLGPDCAQLLIDSAETKIQYL